MLKQTAKQSENLCLRIEIATSMFYLYDYLDDSYLSALILKILVLLMMEWFEDQTLRSHMIANFSMLKLLG